MYLGVGTINSVLKKLGCCLMFAALAGIYPVSAYALGDTPDAPEAVSDTASDAVDGAASNAANGAASDAVDGAASDDDARTPLPDYTDKTHHELTELSTRWDELDSLQRRALLQEVKLRMARGKGPEGVLTIRSQRRYGRIVRKSDGRVLRIETQVVQVRPAGPPAAGAQPGFGVGFERRAESDEQPAESSDIPVTVGVKEPPPVVRVNDPSQ